MPIFDIKTSRWTRDGIDACWAVRPDLKAAYLTLAKAGYTRAEVMCVLYTEISLVDVGYVMGHGNIADAPAPIMKCIDVPPNPAPVEPPKSEFVYKIRVRESERGWGSKQWNEYYDTEAQAKEVIKSTNKRNTSSSVPNWYMQCYEDVTIVKRADAEKDTYRG